MKSKKEIKDLIKYTIESEFDQEILNKALSEMTLDFHLYGNITPISKITDNNQVLIYWDIHSADYLKMKKL